MASEKNWPKRGDSLWLGKLAFIFGSLGNAIVLLFLFFIYYDQSAIALIWVISIDIIIVASFFITLPLSILSLIYEKNTARAKVGLVLSITPYPAACILNMILSTIYGFLIQRWDLFGAVPSP
jgi:hypothetical protein